ncbi:MAG: hypothetical protein AB2A00_21960 [Myxococcota bacterium]
MVASGLSPPPVVEWRVRKPALLSLPSVIMRDRRQVEVKQAYALPQSDEPLDYQLDVFIFLPRSMGMSAHNYPRDEFYNDSTTYLRLDAPGRTLAELADLSDARSPLSQVHTTLAQLMQPRAPPTEPLAALCQLHAHELSEAVISTCVFLAQKAHDGSFSTAETYTAEVNRMLGDSERALVAIRQVRAEADAFGGLVHPAVPRALAYAEEYASAVLDEQVARLAEAIKESQALRDGTGSAVKLLLTLERFAADQSKLRLEAGYAVPWDEPREYFTYRLGLLKKNLQQALYLNTRELRADNYLRNSAAMVAAGLAATWAFLAQVPMLQLGAVDLNTQLWLLASAVGAYMLKDRIKEWTRDYLTRRLRLDDYNRVIFSDVLARLGLKGLSGRAKEKVRFVKLDELDEEIRDIRTLHRSVRGTGLELEEVLHYRRKLSLRAPEGTRFPEGFGVREILRINTRHFTARLDDPLDNVSFFDAERGAFAREDLPKVYHANLVLRISAEHSPERWITRYRMVLTQDGLNRVEPVFTRRVEGKLPRD